MPLIKVWECPVTQKLFRDIGPYRKHLRKQVRKRAKQRERDRQEAEFEQELRQLYRQPDIESIRVWLEDHAGMLVRRAMFHGDHEMLPQDDPKIRVNVEVMRWGDLISNRKVAPFGKPTNFRETDDLPLGYPGWTGIIELVMEGFWCRRLLDGTPIHVTFGGHLQRLNNINRATFEVSLFAEEFKVAAVMRALQENPERRDE